MKKVLLIGSYFPEISYETINNYFLSEELGSKNIELILLSDSWCQVKDKKINFIGDMKELSENKSFSRRYYLDPIQCKFVKNNIYALIGLACKVIEKHKIDKVICTNINRYGIIIDWIKMNYDIEIICSMHNNEVLNFLTENYSKEYSTKILNRIDRILVQDFYEELFISLGVKESKINTCSIINKKEKNTIVRKKILIMGEFDGELEKGNLASIERIINNDFKEYEKNIFIFNESSKNNTAFNKIEEFIQELKNSRFVIDIRQLFKSDKENISFTKMILLLGGRILVNKKVFEYFNSKYDISYEVVGEYIIIKDINNNETAVSDYVM